jgi:dihydroorotase
LARGGVAHDGEVATRLGLAGIPVSAETVALATVLRLAGDTGAKVHVTRISSRAALEMICTARAGGVAVTCDVAVHHLHLCENDIGYFDPHARLDPPLRAQADREALRRGLADGAIDALCSDHTPVDDDAKQRPFDEAEAGATGLELLLPLTLKWATEMQLPLSTALARVTCDGARILGVAAGTLAPGSAADVCIFDPRGPFQVTRSALKSQGKNTPFLGYELAGKVRYTLVDGHLAYDGSWA